MNVKAIHVNLLRDAERVSSSPIRPKVILPLVSGLALVSVLGWWGFQQMQIKLVDSEITSLQSEVDRQRKDFAEACKLKESMQAKEAELNQLKGYLKGRRAWGELLAELALTVPSETQLTLVEIPEPPPQNLQPPPGSKLPPLLGPTNAEERVVFRLAGKAVREESVLSMLKTIKTSAAFTNSLIVAAGDPKGGRETSPRMRKFGQDAVADTKGNRAIVFDVEYETPGRSFAP